MAGEDEVRFRVLGPLEATVAGRPVALGGTKPRALLAALLMQRPSGRVGRRSSSRSCGARIRRTRATSTVRKYVYELRAALGSRSGPRPATGSF